MPFNTQDTDLYRQDVRANGTSLSTDDREAILKKYLPAPPLKPSRSNNNNNRTGRTKARRRRIRTFVKSLIHLAFHLFIQFVFGVYLRLRQFKNAIIQKFLSIRHYHHRTPAYMKKDIDSLSRLPEHLSVLVSYDKSSEDPTALETLIDEVAELAAWSTAAGIPLLSVYEATGVLKIYMSAVQEIVQQKLVQYFGPAPHTPTLRVYAPNVPTLSPMPPPIPSPEINPLDSASGAGINSNHHSHNNLLSTSNPDQHVKPPHLNLMFLSATDGRDTLVDLTRTLTEMSQSSRIKSRDITPTLINTEINATTAFPPRSNSSSPSMSRNSSFTNLLPNDHVQQNGDNTTTTVSETAAVKTTTRRLEKTSAEALPSEPDLLIIFAPYVRLDGYPPWQIRLTEIYCVGDTGSNIGGRHRAGGRTRVEYQGFLRALWKYAGAEMRFGR